jgi:DNA repair protein RadC
MSESIVLHKPINKWPIGERPREKLIALGSENLSNAELLAILISTGTDGLSAVEVGKELLRKFETLEKLASAPRKQLQEVQGIGIAKALILQAAFQLSRKLHMELAERRIAIFKNPANVAGMFIPQIGHLKQEVFAIALLDSAGRFMQSEIITRGTLNASLVHPREVFRPAIQNSAASIILIHNHPSGQLEASKEDLKITQQLVDSGNIIDIPVLDHIILSDTSYLSMHEQGLI